MGTTTATAPRDQWWAINGADILAALHRAHDGQEPEGVYADLLANSERTEPKAEA